MTGIEGAISEWGARTGEGSHGRAGWSDGIVLRRKNIGVPVGAGEGFDGSQLALLVLNLS